MRGAGVAIMLLLLLVLSWVGKKDRVVEVERVRVEELRPPVKPQAQYVEPMEGW